MALKDMELIPNFDIDSFLRTVWVTKEARDVWAGVIPQINSFIQELEVLSVVHGHRRCSWQTIGEDSLIETTKSWENQGLFSIPIKRVGQFQGFAHKHTPIKPGEPCNVCVIVSRSFDDCKLFRKAFEENDNDLQGELLGYPACDRKFFCDVWAKGFYDPVWQAAQNSPKSIVKADGTYCRIKGNPLSNPILRYLGLRACFHIPCSFECEASIKIAEERLALGESIKPDLIKLLRALMRMPIVWDNLKGICVTKSPIFYVITSSCPSKERFVIEVEGDFLPRERGKGVVFPFLE